MGLTSKDRHTKNLQKRHGFRCITSWPHYARSNGFIESQVKTTKRTMKKAKATKSDQFMALLCLRATPIDNDLPSPAELLLGRPIQDNLPKKTSKAATNKEVTNRLSQRQAAQKYETTPNFITWAKCKYPRPKDKNLETSRRQGKSPRSTAILHRHPILRRERNEVEPNTTTGAP